MAAVIDGPKVFAMEISYLMSTNCVPKDKP